jgi:hypothetical protein
MTEKLAELFDEQPKQVARGGGFGGVLRPASRPAVRQPA